MLQPARTAVPAISIHAINRIIIFPLFKSGSEQINFRRFCCRCCLLGLSASPLSTDIGQSLEPLDIYSPTWNAVPGTRQLVIYPDCIIRSLNWGCRPPGSAPLFLRKIVTSRAENVAYSPFLKTLWRSGRVIVPADSWYEWIGTDDGVRHTLCDIAEKVGATVPRRGGHPATRQRSTR
ncbi:SOS response-associated peptidase family protein [Paraburkholderia madseniana]|uniref:SOS response-associated peptidase family protein n=1 Tax=Paraburkholderia madseniana TaxID=2599607 RepID=UPI0039C9CBD5